MEAMTCGLPAVVTRVGDLGDLIADAQNGYLVSPPTAEALGAAVLRLLDDPDRLAAFSAAARESARCFTVEATTERWNGILACRE
jgi:mannosyltransferase